MDKNSTNQIGEHKKAKISSELELIPIDTFGGRVHVKWDSQASLTPLGQTIFLLDF